MKKKPYPTVIKRTSKLPTKAQLKRMKDKIEALSVQNMADKHSLDEDKPMVKKKGKTAEKKARATKKSLTPEDIARMIEEWDNKTTGEWADEFWQRLFVKRRLHYVRRSRKKQEHEQI